MVPSSPGHRLTGWLVVLFAVGTLLGHVCVLEPGHLDLADAPAQIGFAGPHSGEPVAIDEASCESLKPVSAWPVMRAIDSRPLPVAGLAVPGSARTGPAASVRVPRVPLFVLHAALLI